ncbi:hypothetical protein AALO_G00118910, partial [Alosa alosa]
VAQLFLSLCDLQSSVNPDSLSPVSILIYSIQCQASFTPVSILSQAVPHSNRQTQTSSLLCGSPKRWCPADSLCGSPKRWCPADSLGPCICPSPLCGAFDCVFMCLYVKMQMQSPRVGPVVTLTLIYSFVFPSSVWLQQKKSLYHK